MKRPKQKDTPQHKGTPFAAFNLVQIPRQTLEAAKVKSKALHPPRPLRWILLELLSGWVKGRYKTAGEVDEAEPPKPKRSKPLEPRHGGTEGYEPLKPLF